MWTRPILILYSRDIGFLQRGNPSFLLNIQKSWHTHKRGNICYSKHPHIRTWWLKNLLAEICHLNTQNLRTCSAWKKKTRFLYKTRSLQVWWSKFRMLIVWETSDKKFSCIWFLWFTFVWIFTRNMFSVNRYVLMVQYFYQRLLYDNLWKIRTY